MVRKQNLHTHSTFCDGADTPEQMVLAAIEKGFDSIGFSSHGYIAGPKRPGAVTLTPETIPAYFAEIQRLKELYKEQIQIYTGLEADSLTTVTDPFDYLLGAVHILLVDGQMVSFDRSCQVVEDIIRDWFHGDGMAYAQAYYDALARLPEHGKYDIIAHFDLITKHCENACLFDTESDMYRRAWMDAADAFSGKIPLFEVNTGAVARGYRTIPYPKAEIIRFMREKGFGAVISSDCHNRHKLDCNWNEAEILLKECGYREIFLLTEEGFVPTPLE